MQSGPEQRCDIRQLFVAHGDKLTYKKSEFIIRPRETLADVFYIEQGLVKAYDITKYGEENLLIIRRPHEVFPLIWAITGEERPIIYEAMTTCVLRRLPRDTLSTYIHEHPEAYAPLLAMVVDMYRVHAERIFNLEYRTVRERLISFLLTMSGRFGRPISDGLLIDVPLRHQDIASSINASRETTGREISYLEKRGLLRNRQTCIELLQPDTLKQML